MGSTNERPRTSRRDEDRPETTEDRADKKLPVTGEVGSEGGSFADPTYQVAEFEGDVGRTAEASEPVRTDAETADSIKPADE